MMLVRTRVGPSSIHGLGLFAAEPVARGTPVWRFEPGFDRAFTEEQCAAFLPAVREHLRWFGFCSLADGRVVLSGDHACFMNHAASPNTGAPPDAQAPTATVALRDIAAGEELTCDYFAFDADASRKLGGGAP
jgi:uncharacterized protein